MTRPLVRLPRAALSGVFFFLYGLFSLPFAPFVLVLPRRAGRWIVRLFYRLFVALARVTGLFRVEAQDVAAPPRGKVVVMNHVSLIDICVLLAHLPDSVCIAKAAAKRNPFLSAVVSRLFIANDSGWEKTAREASGFLERGVNVVVFPQGTRGGQSLRRGAARLALATRRGIVPYRIAYDPVVLAKGQPWWDVGDGVVRIRLERLDEIAPDGPNNRPAAVAITDRLKGICAVVLMLISPNALTLALDTRY